MLRVRVQQQGNGGVGLCVLVVASFQAAFRPEWWNATGNYGGYTQIESNFAMFWGVAIMLYEATLVSDEAPIDHYIGWSGNPPDPKALSPQEVRGLAPGWGSRSRAASHARTTEPSGSRPAATVAPRS